VQVFANTRSDDVRIGRMLGLVSHAIQIIEVVWKPNGKTRSASGPAQR
jgi:hypothetical protein